MLFVCSFGELLLLMLKHHLQFREVLVDQNSS